MGRGAAKRGPSRPKSLDPKELRVLRGIVEARPSLTLKQISELLKPHVGKRLSPTTCSLGLKKIGFRKVRPPKAPAQDGAEKPLKGTRYRKVHRREPSLGRYPSSLTDHEWEVLSPLLDLQQERGRPTRHDRRVLWDAVFYLVRSGAPWRMLPSDLPPYKAVFAFFARARDSGLLEQVYDRLHALWRERGGRETTPSAGIVDSQSVKTTEKGGFTASTRARR